MTLLSNSFENLATIPHKYIKDGDNISPHLQWSDFPKETKSFAVLCHDVDAPTQSGFWHWQVVNIPAHITSLEEGVSGQISFALEKNNDSDGFGWYGPQPPKGHGPHKYIFTVLALDVESIDTTTEQSRAYTSFMLWQHIIDSAKLTGIYEQK